MPVHKGDVDIPRFADRFAVIESFQHREQARVFLHQPGQRIEMSGTAMSAQPFPLGLRAARGSNGRIHIGWRGLAQGGQHFARGGIARLEPVAGGW